MYVFVYHIYRLTPNQLQNTTSDTNSSISDEKNDNNKRQLFDNIKDKKKPHRKFLLILPGIIWDCHTVEVEEDLKNKSSSKEEK